MEKSERKISRHTNGRTIRQIDRQNAKKKKKKKRLLGGYIARLINR